MKERLQDLINYLIAIKAIENKADFCQKVGLGKSFLSDLLSGRSRITKRTCELISQRFVNIDADWLLTGAGAMLKNIEEPPQPDRSLDIVATLLDMMNTVMKRCDALEKRCDELSKLLLANDKLLRSGTDDASKPRRGDTFGAFINAQTDGKDVRHTAR